MIAFGRCPFGHFYYSPSSPVMEIWSFGLFAYRKFLPTETTLKLIAAKKEVEAYQARSDVHPYTCGNGCDKPLSVLIKPTERLYFKCWRCGYEQIVPVEDLI